MIPEMPELSARISHDWTSVILRADEIRTDTLRAFADMWATNPDRVTAVLDYLADAASAGTVGSWEQAVENVPGDLDMGLPEVALTEIDAVRLTDELRAASRAALTARLRASQPVEITVEQLRVPA